MKVNELLANAIDFPFLIHYPRLCTVQADLSCLQLKWNPYIPRFSSVEFQTKTTVNKQASVWFPFFHVSNPGSYQTQCCLTARSTRNWYLQYSKAVYFCLILVDVILFQNQKSYVPYMGLVSVVTGEALFRPVRRVIGPYLLLKGNYHQFGTVKITQNMPFLKYMIFIINIAFYSQNEQKKKSLKETTRMDLNTFVN